MKRLLAASLIVISAATGAVSQEKAFALRLSNDTLETVASFAHDRPIAMVVSREGRRFVNLPYSNFSTDLHAASIVEVKADCSPNAFPDAAWNAGKLFRVGGARSCRSAIRGHRFRMTVGLHELSNVSFHGTFAVKPPSFR
jgi:hypothetical protein